MVCPLVLRKNRIIRRFMRILSDGIPIGKSFRTRGIIGIVVDFLFYWFLRVITTILWKYFIIIVSHSISTFLALTQPTLLTPALFPSGTKPSLLGPYPDPHAFYHDLLFRHVRLFFLLLVFLRLLMLWYMGICTFWGSVFLFYLWLFFL